MPFSEICSPAVLPCIWENDGASLDGYRNARGERKDIDDDECLTVCECGNAFRSPLATHIESFLIRERYFELRHYFPPLL
jgi:hypothetical protein